MGLDDGLIERVREPNPETRVARILALFQAEGFRVRVRAGTQRPVVRSVKGTGLMSMLEADGTQNMILLLWPEWEDRDDLTIPE